MTYKTQLEHFLADMVTKNAGKDFSEENLDKIAAEILHKNHRKLLRRALRGSASK